MPAAGRGSLPSLLRWKGPASTAHRGHREAALGGPVQGGPQAVRRLCSLPKLLDGGSSSSLEEFKHGLTSTRWRGGVAAPTAFWFHDSQMQRACAFCLVFQRSRFCGPGGGHGCGPGPRRAGDGWCWALGGLPCPGPLLLCLIWSPLWRREALGLTRLLDEFHCAPLVCQTPGRQ